MCGLFFLYGAPLIEKPIFYARKNDKFPFLENKV